MASWSEGWVAVCLSLLLGLGALGCAAERDPAGGGGGSEEVDAGASFSDADCVCSPGSVECDGNDVKICAPSCQKWVERSCPENNICMDGACVECACEPGSFDCFSETVRRVCRNDCTAWDYVQCEGGEACGDGLCRGQVCQPGETRCTDINRIERCSQYGTEWIAENCPARALCMAPPNCGLEVATCKRIQCDPPETRCSADGELGGVEICRHGGTCWEKLPCGEGRVCAEDQCRDLICEPFSVSCAEALLDTVLTCNETGTSASPRQCAPGQVCVSGQCETRLCREGYTQCGGVGTMRRCNEDQSGWDTIFCDPGQVCEQVCDDLGCQGSCQATVCDPQGGPRCVQDDLGRSRILRICSDTGASYRDVECARGLVCDGGRCRPKVCERGEMRCLTTDIREICNQQETGWIMSNCGGNDDEACAGGGCGCEVEPQSGEARCAPRICLPGSSSCLENNIRQVCSPGGTYYAEANCGNDAVCEGDRCVALQCSPDHRRCLSPELPARCNDLGTGYVPQDRCRAVEIQEGCRAGRCESGCETAAALHRAEGCRFVLPGHVLDAAQSDWVLVAVANPTPSQANIELFQAGLDVAELEVLHFSDDVPNPSFQAQQPPVVLPGFAAALVRLSVPAPAQPGLSDQLVRMRSSIPVFAYQVDGYNAGGALIQGAATTLSPGPVRVEHEAGEEVYSGSWGTEHVVGTWPPGPEHRSTLTVVTGASPSRVGITPSVALAAAEGVPAISANQRAEIVLPAYQVLRLQPQDAGADLTGTTVDGTREVAVFVGAPSAQPILPGGVPCCDDPISHIVPPRHALGSDYVAFGAQGEDGEPRETRWRIVAVDAAVDVFTVPNVAGMAALPRGATIDLTTDEAFALHASGQIMLLKIAEGQGQDGALAEPAVTVMPPLAQASRQLAVTVPTGLSSAYVDVIWDIGGSAVHDAPSRGEVRLDGLQWTRVGDSGFRHIRLSVAPGLHRFEATLGRGVLVSLGAVGETTAWSLAVSMQSSDLSPPPPPPPEEEGE